MVLGNRRENALRSGRPCSALDSKGAVNEEQIVSVGWAAGKHSRIPNAKHYNERLKKVDAFTATCTYVCVALAAAAG